MPPPMLLLIMSAIQFPDTQLEAFRFFEDEKNCHQFMARIRWTNGEPVCPSCGSKEIGTLVVVKYLSKSKKEGVEPKTLTRRFWVCKKCRKQFTVKVGTILEDSPLSLAKWLCSLWLIVNAKNGISSCEIARTLGITQKSAWFLAHRLRLALHEGTFEKTSGNVESDETLIGGQARNEHKGKRKAKRTVLEGRRWHHRQEADLGESDWHRRSGGRPSGDLGRGEESGSLSPLE